MNSKQASIEQETLLSKELGWKRVSGSGARPNFPGDIVSERWLGECKTHVSPGHKIVFSRSVWSKLTKEAASVFKYPALFVDDGSRSLDKTWVLVPDFVHDDEFIVLEYLYDIKTNIVFDSNSLFNQVIYRGSNGSLCYRTSFDGHRVKIINFNNFKKLFGD